MLTFFCARFSMPTPPLPRFQICDKSSFSLFSLMVCCCSIYKCLIAKCKFRQSQRYYWLSLFFFLLKTTIYICGISSQSTVRSPSFTPCFLRIASISSSFAKRNCRKTFKASVCAAAQKLTSIAFYHYLNCHGLCHFPLLRTYGIFIIVVSRVTY